MTQQTPTPDLRLRVIAETLRFLADDWVGSPADQLWMTERATALLAEEWRSRSCCPLCSEIMCDDNCPVGPIR